jgi:hypothetical protein
MRERITTLEPPGGLSMNRRRFIYKFTAASAAGAAASVALAPSQIPAQAESSQLRGSETRSVTYRVKGFICATCAVGLEAMLRGFRGVTRATASYPACEVVIGFDERLTDENALEAFIAECGFSAVA